MSNLQGKVVVVTGGGSGIGHGIALEAARRGASVVIGDISGNEERVAAEIGDAAVGVHCDVSQSSEVEQLVRIAVSAFGGVHGMVNVAGISGDLRLIGETSDELLDTVLAVNFKGVFYGTRAAVNHMAEHGGGSIVNISSVASDAIFPGRGSYAAAKGAINSLTRQAAAEYAHRGVRVNAIQPGRIRTPLFDKLATPAYEAEAVGRTPLGRMGTPRDIANMAMFLVSDESAFVTGVVMPVDGGWLLMGGGRESAKVDEG